MTEPAPNWLWLVPAWGAYFVLHSALASQTVKSRIQARWPGAVRWYRLAYNGIAILALLPIAFLMWLEPGPRVWAFEGLAFWFANGLAILALVGFWWSLRWYDGADFLGLRQWRSGSGSIDGAARLCLSPLHREVRHPWYSFGLVLIWTRDMNASMLVSALAMTVYFVLGSRLEESKLSALYGEAYRRYRQEVPGLVPRPWKRLSAARARQLEQLAAAAVAGRPDASSVEHDQDHKA